MSSIIPVKATAKTIKELFHNQYLIDYYQREYKWQTKQIKELIEDLTNKFRQFYSEDHEPAKISTYAPYFLGSVIISSKEGENYIIDGQQRMTSLTLLLMFLRNQQKDKSNPSLDGYIRSDSFGTVNFNINVKERNQVMEAVFRDDENYRIPDSSPDSVVNIYERYQDIQSLFPEDIYDNKALTFFIYWLIEKVQIIEIVAYSDEEAYTIFETMNDRGLSLTPVDMLKGFILANIDEAKRSEVAQIWKEKMLLLKSEIGENAEHEFFRDFFRSKYATKIRSGKSSAPQDFDKMASEFHRWFRDAVNDLKLKNSEDFYSFVKDTISFYIKQYIFLNKASSSMVQGYERVCYTAYSELPHFKIMMLSSISENDTEEEIRLKYNTVATFLETVLMKRTWENRNTTDAGFRQSAFAIVKTLRNKNIKEIAQVGVKIADSPDMSSFVGSITMTPQNKRRIYRILARLTDYLEIKNGQPSLYQSLFDSGRQGYEIEHILANNKVDVTTLGFSSQQEFSSQRDEIGNLLLLPKPFNASYSNNTYQQKTQAAVYPSQNILAGSLSPLMYNINGVLIHQPRLNQFLNDNNILLKPYTDFTKSSMQDRTALYAEIMKAIFDSKHILHEAGITEKPEDYESIDIEDIFSDEHTNSSNNKKVVNFKPESTIQDLLLNLVLTPNTKIFSYSTKYNAEAIILQDGNIQYKEEIYTSLSSAALAVIKEKSPNRTSESGWDFWGIIQENGEFKSLNSYRKEYEAS